MRNYGEVWLEKDRWHIKAEPQILLRLKRYLDKVDKGEFGTVLLSDNDENRLEIDAFLYRFRLKISPKDRSLLTDGTKRVEDKILTLEQILGPKYKPKNYKMALQPRTYQAQVAEIVLKNGFLLVGDDVGLGKTCEAITCFSDRRTLPAIVVTLAGTLPDQWATEVKRFIPDLYPHVIDSRGIYEFPLQNGRTPDVIVTTYHKIKPWAEVLAEYGKMVVFDEAQELRHSDSAKYEAAKYIARSCVYSLGLSATPIFGYGGEIYNVLDVLKEDCLGNREEFIREWCSEDGGKRKVSIRDPKAFGGYLREQFLMIRRTREEVKRELPPLSKIPYHVPADASALDKVKDSAAALAKIILSQDKIAGFDKLQAKEQLSYLLRQATGIGKAPYVADFIRLIVANGEKALVFCWHREVYEILMSKLSDPELGDLKPVLFTGSETPKEKLASKERFMKGDSKVMLMSLRAGQGVDGLQHSCKTVIFAELDWAPAVHEQNIGRVFRDGQKDPVTTFFLITDSGSDPIVAEALGIKTAQLEGIRNPNQELIEKLQQSSDWVEKLAKDYLTRHKKGRNEVGLEEAS